MKRFDNWQTLLGEVLRPRPFVWGENDCALHACNAVQAITGVDLAGGFRGTYDSALSAARAIKEYCGGDLEALAEKIAAENSIQEVAPLFARRGDVVLFEVDEQGPSLGVVGLNGSTVAAMTRPGSRKATLRDAKRAWRIG